jgi:predicted nucleic acid-binding protein
VPIATRGSAVVDASAIVRRLRREPEALAWFEGARLASTELRAPALLALEVGNALLQYARAGAISAGSAHRGLRWTLYAIALVDVTPLSARSLEIALDREITTYDAAYVVLAERTGAPLVTADRRLAAATANAVLIAE